MELLQIWSWNSDQNIIHKLSKLSKWLWNTQINIPVGSVPESIGIQLHN